MSRCWSTWATACAGWASPRSTSWATAAATSGAWPRPPSSSTTATTGHPTVFHHVPEYYNHDKVRQYIQEDLKIPEQMEYTASRGSDGLHEELSIDAVMSVADPTSIRYEQRVKAGGASINGVSLEPLSKTQELGPEDHRLPDEAHRGRHQGVPGADGALRGSAPT